METINYYKGGISLQSHHDPSLHYSFIIYTYTEFWRRIDDDLRKREVTLYTYIINIINIHERIAAYHYHITHI